ncbi:hypothetical protein [Nostoc sp.]|uniref:hypothetical protein n=1 Tax=Nostoc sp. TaxID=1180 RepID=UPI002FF744C4
MTIQQLIEWLQTLPSDSVISITDVYDGQEFSIFAIEPGATKGTVSIEINKKDDEGDEG